MVSLPQNDLRQGREYIASMSSEFRIEARPAFAIMTIWIAWARCMGLSSVS